MHHCRNVATHPTHSEPVPSVLLSVCVDVEIDVLFVAKSDSGRTRSTMLAAICDLTAYWKLQLCTCRGKNEQ